MNRQESKYQAYIIDQMNEKNKLAAAARIQAILIKEVNKVNDSVLHNIASWRNNEDKSSFSDAADKEDSITVNFILVKLCTSTINRVFTKVRMESTKAAFAQLHRCFKNTKILEKGMNTLKVLCLRQSFRKIMTHESRQINHL